MIVVGLLNFGWMLSDSESLGGDALNGYVRDGHYFVGSHGRYTEVGASEWIANRNHEALTIITSPFLMLAAAFLIFRYVFPYVMSGGTTRRPDQGRVAHVRGSSSLLASTGSGGRIGDVHMSAGMLDADVYAAGVVVHPRFMAAAAIPVEEIRSVHHVRGPLGKRLEIEHDGLEIASPVAVFVGEDSDVARAIAAITADRSSIAAWGAHPPASSSSTSGLDTSVGRPGPPLLLRMMSVTGLLVGVVMVIIGVTRAIPTLGVFGVVWTAFGVAILTVNVVRFVRRGY